MIAYRLAMYQDGVFLGYSSGDEYGRSATKNGKIFFTRNILLSYIFKISNLTSYEYRVDAFDLNSVPDDLPKDIGQSENILKNSNIFVYQTFLKLLFDKKEKQYTHCLLVEITDRYNAYTTLKPYCSKKLAVSYEISNHGLHKNLLTKTERKLAAVFKNREDALKFKLSISENSTYYSLDSLKQ